MNRTKNILLFPILVYPWYSRIYPMNFSIKIIIITEMYKQKLPFHILQGTPLPFGASIQEQGINFAIFSRAATTVHLIIDCPSSSGQTTRYDIPLHPEQNRTGDIWHICLDGVDPELYYGYQIAGAPDTSLLQSDTPAPILIDPYCQALRPRAWGAPCPIGQQPCCRLLHHDFDWQGDSPLKTPLKDSIIYELHVRGFTRAPHSQTSHPGTYQGIIEQIPYLQKLGITAIELLPVTEFDENDPVITNPGNDDHLKNFWGYSPLSFFALKSGYAADPENHINEFKAMILALHQAGIEVILDMVYNHSGEGGYNGPTSSFRGIDNSIYYLLDPESREYLNFSGCGNTMNCNHPVVRDMIRDSLRYWVMEMHVDGFRFDLASILGRDTTGQVLANPPMIEIIAEDPILRNTKIIAEAWDAAGLYQVGSFSTDRRWAEWNGRFRDDVRAFMAGHEDTVAALATRIAGSSDLYQVSGRHPCNSINFITSHDGFTLADLVSYEQKHNLANGEDNRDGDNHNISWNSGQEGISHEPAIQALRLKRMRSLMVILLLSQGVPMISAGDEFGQSQQGNNNAWCQDNETSWLNWKLVDTNKDFFRFCKKCIQLRQSHPVFRRPDFFQFYQRQSCEDLSAGISWQSLDPCLEDWSPTCHHLGFLLKGSQLDEPDDDFLILLNGERETELDFILPAVPRKDEKRLWHLIIDSNALPPHDFGTPSQARPHAPGASVTVAMMAVMVFQSAPAGQ